MQGHKQIVEFLAKKWQKENGYRLRKDLFAWTDNKIAVQVSDSSRHMANFFLEAHTTRVDYSSSTSGMLRSLTAGSSGIAAMV